MTYQQPYPPTTPAPRPKRRAMTWILTAVGVTLLLCIGLAALGALTADDNPTADATTPPTTTAAAEKPTPADFTLTAKITEQTCYGEAGCAVTWLPEITYTGPALTTTWLIRYTVEGTESGTKAGTIVMGPTGPAKQSEKRGRTAAEDSKITLKITGIEPG